jgi:hypothetical protein
MPNLTPRWILQYWGTEVCRRGFHDDIWIASLENKLRSSRDDVVVSDCRFPNEIKSIKDAGGIIVWVKRGALPEWYNLAVEANQGSNVAANELKMNKIHASETSWVGTDFDVVLDNNGSIDDLYEEIKNLVLNRPAAKLTLPDVKTVDSLHIQF